MVRLVEFRITLPMTVDEYHVGQLYMVAKTSRQNTNANEGVEMLINEPYEDATSKGQYTHKIYHLGSHVPSLIRPLIPSSALKLDEKAWNAYPYCRTVLACPFFSKAKIEITTVHLDDDGTTENAHNLSEKDLKIREVVNICIASDPIEPKDYKANEDPTLIRCEKRNRGPLAAGWQKTMRPIMCCYKLVRIEHPYFGMQSSVEKFLVNFERMLFFRSHRQCYCWMDEWIDLSIADIRRIEAETAAELRRLKGLPPLETDEKQAQPLDAADPGPRPEDEAALANGQEGASTQAGASSRTASTTDAASAANTVGLSNAPNHEAHAPPQPAS